MKKDFTKTFIGLILILIGASLLFNQLGLETIFGFSLSTIISTFWPLILIFLGVSLLFNRKVQGGVILVIIGTLLMLNILFDMNFWSLLWPILIIGIGISILLKGSLKTTTQKSSENEITINSIFTGTEKKITSKNLKVCNIFTMFGATELDLSDANIDKDGAIIDTTTLLGGIEIITPKNVTVKSEGTAFLGAWEEKTQGKEGPVLTIKGSVILGGVEIK